MSNFDVLVDEVLMWAERKGILAANDKLAQQRKFLEEAMEYIMEHDPVKKKVELGDVLVTVIINAELHGWDVSDCLEDAWNKIRNRTGKMVDGAFVKDES